MYFDSLNSSGVDHELTNGQTDN